MKYWLMLIVPIKMEKKTYYKWICSNKKDNVYYSLHNYTNEELKTVLFSSKLYQHGGKFSQQFVLGLNTDITTKNELHCTKDLKRAEKYFHGKPRNNCVLIEILACDKNIVKTETQESRTKLEEFTINSFNNIYT